MNSASRPRRPSGEPCIEELLVVSCVVSGDIMGDACRELEVVTEEALMAEAGTEDAVEWMEGRKVVCTCVGFVCLVEEAREDGGVIVVDVESWEGVVANCE